VGRPRSRRPHAFRILILEGAQAGLSWQTVLNKRENYRKSFDNFDVGQVALYGARDVDRLLADQGKIRNRLKIAAVIQNGQALLKVQKEFGSFDVNLWQFVGRKPIDHKFRALKDIPATTKESDA
jgi:DNA-3-methyladenine glycosylase I